MKVLGIIPARGGSKGVSKKNIRVIDGKPLIAYTIETAMQSSRLTDVLVSTDDLEIKEVAMQYGCDVQLRSKVNASDTAKIEAVIEEVLSKLKTNYDILMLLQPTAPIRDVEDIDKVVDMFQKPRVESVVSLVELEDIHPARMYHIDTDNFMLPLDTKLEKQRRQDLPKVYLRNGCIYAVRTRVFEREKKVITEHKSAYIMPESKWANIDSERDLVITEALIKLWKKGKL